jgi:hypothetical protein
MERCDVLRFQHAFFGQLETLRTDSDIFDISAAEKALQCHWIGTHKLLTKVLPLLLKASSNKVTGRVGSAVALWQLFVAFGAKGLSALVWSLPALARFLLAIALCELPSGACGGCGLSAWWC